MRAVRWPRRPSLCLFHFTFFFISRKNSLCLTLCHLCLAFDCATHYTLLLLKINIIYLIHCSAFLLLLRTAFYVRAMQCKFFLSLQMSLMKFISSIIRTCFNSHGSMRCSFERNNCTLFLFVNFFFSATLLNVSIMIWRKKYSLNNFLINLIVSL